MVQHACCGPVSLHAHHSFPLLWGTECTLSLRITLSHSQIMCVSNTDFHCTPNSFFFFFWLRGMWELCSLTRDWTCNPCIGKVKVKSLSHVWLFATPWTVVYQAPQSMEFSRQEYWSELPFPSPPTTNVKPPYCLNANTPSRKGGRTWDKFNRYRHRTDLCCK